MEKRISEENAMKVERQDVGISAHVEFGQDIIEKEPVVEMNGHSADSCKRRTVNGSILARGGHVGTTPVAKLAEKEFTTVTQFRADSKADVDKPANDGGSTSTRVAIFGAAMLIASFQPLVLKLAGDRRSAEEKELGADGFMLAAEVIKFALCGLIILGRRALGIQTVIWCGIEHTIPFAVPAAIYLGMNIMKVFAARELSPPVFQLLASTKILATALASWAVMGKVLSRMQWLAMVLLTAGVALGQQKTNSGLNDLDTVALLPTVVMVVNAFVSAAGAVYTEKVLKARHTADLSIFVTNLHMSTHSLLLNVLKACVLGVPFVPKLWNLGFWTWAALLNEAINGILVSALMRHADSIVKNYAFAASIFLTTGISVPVLRYWPEVNFLFGAILVVASMYVYYTHAVPAPTVVSNDHAKKIS